MTPEQQAVRKALADPFPPAVLGWKAQTAKGNRALAVAYIDARDVMDRLDDVVGPENWRSEYQQIGPNSVECRLSLRFGGEWVPKADVGSTSDQPDAGDKLKAAYSDALKRAAVHWGIGRYLYNLLAVWCDYDPQRKQLTQTPQLPAWAVPKSPQPAKTAPPQTADGQPQQPPAGKPKGPATLKALYDGVMAKGPPATADQLAAGVAWVDKHLVRLLPVAVNYLSGDLSASVCKFARVDALTAVGEGTPLVSAWGHVRQYVGNAQTNPPDAR